MLRIGQWTSICCFKHNNTVHRIWDKALVLENSDDLLIVGNDSANVYENDGRSWQVKEPAITIFFKKYWYNIICMIRENGIHYYCNIASPYVVKDDKIIYIDYDLDISVKPNMPLRILDEIEYQHHRKEMHYSKALDLIIKKSLFELMEKYEKHEYPFDDSKINEYYSTFLKLK